MANMLDEVRGLKAILAESSSKPAEEVLGALGRLQAMGSLPTKVLSETLVGKVVNQLAKDAADAAVKAKAKNLVDEWRQAHRKKRNSNGGDGGPALKRSASSALSLGIGSEASPRASQDLDASLTLQAASQEESNVAIPEEVAAAAEATPSEPPASAEDAAPTSQPSLERAGSTLSEGMAEGKLADYRVKVKHKILEALGQAEEVETKGGEDEASTRDPVVLAEEIEEELNKHLPKKDAYMSQARSILYNLKDKSNSVFRFKVMVGFFKPSQLPTLTSEDMATDEKNAERAKQRKDAMDAIDQQWAMKNGQMNLTGMFTCGKCKGTKTTYFQMQTRSSDEPMTTFVTCLTCGNRWKFC
eukprot:TRINITY_DN17081_c0_g1_i1.p1 TRINITY_DN17081_c0_g1~~TRINITY_DN17081_c0_g1_i1.p1  ORF type:complete len:358 (-),score=106.68 TRINITY_DN17081_c0_g1_i1:514-1587(-)